MTMRFRALVSILAAGILSGCAQRAAAPEAPADTAPASPDASLASEPMDLDDAALNFERAEAQLDQLLAASGGDGKAAAAPERQAEVGADRPGDDPAPDSAKPAGPAPPPATRSRDGAGAGGLSQGGGCLRACDALTSMKRSADRLCDLTGGDDPRCVDVTARYDRAERRVTRACAACS
jgi:hypothetical protein